MFRNAKHVVLIVAVLVAAAWWSAGAVQAHAVMKKIEPSDGALLNAAPKTVLLAMNEDVSLISSKLFDQTGAEVPLRPVTTKGRLLEMAVDKALVPGDYLFSYRITSGDGHPVFGAVQFRVLGAKEKVNLLGLRERVEQDVWRTPVLALRILNYASLMAAAGGMLLILFVGVPAQPVRQITLYLRGSALVGVASGVLLLGGGGAELGGLGYLSLFTAEPWGVALDTSNATSALLATLGLALIGAATLKPVSPGQHDIPWIAGAAGAVLAAFSFAVSGHVSTAEPRWLMTIIVVAHVICASFWIGSLYPLLLTIRLSSREEASATLKGFSQLSLFSVASLMVAGVIMSWVQLQNLDGFATPYGWRLAVKLAFVSGLLAIAVLNKSWFTPLFERGVERGGRLLSRALQADLLLAAGVVFATAALNLDPPPRNLNAHGGEQFDDKFVERGGSAASGHAAMHSALEFFMNADGGYRLNGALSPVTASESRAQFSVIDKDGKPVQAVEASLRLSNPDKGIEALTWKAAPASDGALRVESLKLPFPGKWKMAVDVVVDDFTKLAFAGEVKIDLTSHGEEKIDSAGSLLNEDVDKLPQDCPVISRDVPITVKAGVEYAKPGEAYGYDRNVWDVPGCARVTITLVNEDQVRHQFMVHGLPKYIYPMGMFHVEANGGVTRAGTFIVASSPRTLLVHCDIAHHMEKGLKGEIKVAGGTGDLPSIPGVTASRSDMADRGWGKSEWLALALGAVGAALAAFAAVRAGRILLR